MSEAKPPIQTFPFDLGEFYSHADKYYALQASGEPIDEMTTYMAFDQRGVESAMASVIARYGIRQKSLFSVGAGGAHEEYWFYRSGCKLVLLDTLEQGYTEHFKERLAGMPPKSPDRAATYVVGDYFVFIADYQGPTYDFCYISSFHPDELDREAVQASFRNRITSQRKYDSYASWPEGMPPFLQAMMDAQKLISDGGLLLIQSYRGGVDLIQNPHYPRLMRDQLRANSLELIEIHYFKASPGIVLVAAVKGAGHVRAWQQKLRDAPPLVEFHGRYPDAVMRCDIGRWTPADIARD